MSWILNPDGESPIRKRPAKLPNMPKPGVGNTSAPGTPGSARTESLPGSPWAEFPLKDNYPKVPDPVDPDRMVSTKQANRPFLAHAEYRAKKEQEHEAWAQRMKERDEKIARGEKVGPPEADPTEVPEVGCLGLLKFILYATIFIVLMGKFITGSFLWEQDVLGSLKQFIPTNQRLFSENMLATFDGTVESKPIYLAIDGLVYDVTPGRATYGPGGSYHLMAGKDAARAYATGCFKDHQTHDIRGLSEKEMAGLTHWKKFYAESKKYSLVGRVSHPPIDPSSPIPKHCIPEKDREQQERLATEAKVKSSKGHDEL